MNIKGYQVEVDEEDAYLLYDHKWYVSKTKEGLFYVKGYNKGRWIYLHRIIMKANKGQEIDHANGNRLDNRKINLRFCTRQQNIFNKVKSRSNTSGFKGVTWHKATRKWMAQIDPGGKHICLGYFDNPVLAHDAYKKAAIEYAGEFARW